jgi:hypothetical protein
MAVFIDRPIFVRVIAPLFWCWAQRGCQLHRRIAQYPLVAPPSIVVDGQLPALRPRRWKTVCSA